MTQQGKIRTIIDDMYIAMEAQRKAFRYICFKYMNNNLEELLFELSGEESWPRASVWPCSNQVQILSLGLYYHQCLISSVLYPSSSLEPVKNTESHQVISVVTDASFIYMEQTANMTTILCSFFEKQSLFLCPLDLGWPYDLL